MIIDNLASLPSTITTGDELPVERGATVYKIDYNALAAAIIAQITPAGIGALAPSDVVNNLTSGGVSVPLSAEMGKALAKNSQFEFYDTNYTSLSDAINSVRTSASYPLTFVKVDTVSSSPIMSDIPSDVGNSEFVGICVGNAARMIVFIVKYANQGKVYFRRMYNGSWGANAWYMLEGQS